MEQLRLYPVADGHCFQELPSGSDAADMWAHGLGSTQTTPSTSAQAVPAPMLLFEEGRRVLQEARLPFMDAANGRGRKRLSLPRFKFST